MQRLAVMVVLTALGWLACTGAADADVASIRPSLQAAEQYDDNVDLSERKRSDFVTTFRPGVELQFTDYPWDVRLGGYLRGEIYARHSDLDNADSFGVSGSVRFNPERVLTLSLAGAFTQSTDAAEVDPQAGVSTGRRKSYGYTMSAGPRWQMDPRTTLGLSYAGSFYWSDAASTNDSATHSASLYGEREVTRRLQGVARYTYSRFVIEGERDRNSHQPRVGVVYELSPAATITAEGGPIFLERSDGSLYVTAGGTLSYAYAFKQGRLAYGYDGTSSTSGVVGEASVIHRVFANLSLQPLRLLTVSLDGSIGSSNSPGSSRGDYRTYGAGLRLGYQLSRWLSLDASYRYTRQDGHSSSVQDFDRNLLSIGLTASDRFRLY